MPSQIYKPIDHLVWFGDSWPAGVPGPLDQAFPTLVGNNLKITSLNYSRPGSSIPEVVRQFYEWKTNDYDPNKKYILIVCLTNNDRFYWKNDNWFTVAPWIVYDALHDPGNPGAAEVINFYKHSYNKEALDFYNTCCIGHLKNLSNEWSIPLYFVRNFENMSDDCKKNSLLDTGLLQFLLDNNNVFWSDHIKHGVREGHIGKGLFEKCLHPTAAGHKKIADILTDKLRLIIEGE
jgi:hypothetical protein